MSEELSFQDAVANVAADLGQVQDQQPENVEEEQPETAQEPDVSQAEQAQEHLEIELEDNTESIPDVQAPNSWSTEDKEVFNTLTPQAQAIVARRERETRSNESRQMSEFNERQKQLETRETEIKTKQAELVSSLQALQVGEPDIALLDEDPDQYHRDMAAFKKSQSEFVKANQALQEQQALDSQAWQQDQIKIYQEHFPEFVDSKLAPKLHDALIDYVGGILGVDKKTATDRLIKTGAHDMRILNESRLYREALARSKSGKVKPKAKALKTGSSNPVTAKQTSVKSAASQFERDRSPAAAAALLQAGRRK